MYGGSFRTTGEVCVGLDVFVYASRKPGVGGAKKIHKKVTK